MDRWEDDEAFRVARELHGGPVVSANKHGSTANCGSAAAPLAALDALFETAWSFPGFRVSYGSFEGTSAVRFHTSAGAEEHAALDCVRIDLGKAPRLLEALRSTDGPVDFEDVQSDSRLRPIAAAFVELGCRSMLVLPLFRERKPVGLVMMDRANPRTWGAKEAAALDRIAPLIALTLEFVEAKAELDSIRSTASRHERRIDAIRGMTAGIAMDAERIVSALRTPVERTPAATRSLLGLLDRLVGDLARVQHGPSTLTQPFDLGRMLRELGPGLDALVAAQVHIDIGQTNVDIEGNVVGVERLLVNLVTHLSAGASSSLTIRLGESRDERTQLRLSGCGLNIDDSLLRTCSGDTLTSSEQVCPALWQARSEALLQDILLSVEDDVVIVELPASAVERRAKKSAG